MSVPMSLRLPDAFRRAGARYVPKHAVLVGLKDSGAAVLMANQVFVLHDGRLQEKSEMAKYGKKAQDKVERAMHERKRGTLRSGRSGKKVTSRKQAIAIGLSEARKAGGKVPKPKTGTRRKSKKR